MKPKGVQNARDPGRHPAFLLAGLSAVHYGVGALAKKDAEKPEAKELDKPESRTHLFVKRPQGHYDFIPGGVMGIGMQQDAVYLTITGIKPPAPASGQLTAEEMAEWVRSLRDNGFTLAAVDGLGMPYTIGA